jgi:UDP-N-acetylglucosamine:LPS N-acetylglucosamine transferase
MKLNNIIMFACSEGGHFAQMMALSQLFGQYHSVLVTDNYRANKEMPALRDIQEIVFVGGIADSRKKNANNRHNDSRLTYIKGYLKLFGQCFKVLKQYRPKVIVSTGSNVAVPLFWFGKLLGCKLIFIETRAHVYNKSLTGKLVDGISNVVIVQWKEMLNVYKKAEYYGVLV